MYFWTINRATYIENQKDFFFIEENIKILLKKLVMIGNKKVIL